MPTQWSLTFTPPPSAVLPAHPHALACTLLESSTEDHTAQTKPSTTAQCGDRLPLSRSGEDCEPDLSVRLRGPIRLGTHVAEPSLIKQRFEPYTRMASAPPPTRKVTVSFNTPAHINQGCQQLPLPVPQLLLAGLFRRWSAFNPQPLPESATTEVLENTHLARHSVRSLATGSSPGQRTGFVEQVVFGSPTHTSRQAQRVFAALWSFSAFAGLGSQATHGLGHVRVQVDHRVNTNTEPEVAPRNEPPPVLSERSP